MSKRNRKSETHTHTRTLQPKPNYSVIPKRELQDAEKRKIPNPGRPLAEGGLKEQMLTVGGERSGGQRSTLRTKNISFSSKLEAPLNEISVNGVLGLTCLSMGSRP